MTDEIKLSRKVTKTTVREFNAEGELVGKTTTVTVELIKEEPDRVVGFARPVEIAK